MLFVSRLPLDAQAQVLVSALNEHGAVLDRGAATRLCLSLAGREEKEAAKWLRNELESQRIALKHTHALQLVGKIAGREAWHSPPTAASRYRLMLTGLDAERGWDTTSSDPREPLEALCAALSGWAARVTAPRVVALRRGPQELLVSQDPVADEQGFVALFKAEAATDWSEWYTFQNYAVKRLRRVLEEGDAPVFLQGAVLGMLSSEKTEGVRELRVLDHGIEIGRGMETHVLRLMEVEARDELLAARADGNTIVTATHLFHVSETYRTLEPALEMSERTLLHPETELLLRQYQLFRRKVGPLAELKAIIRYTAPDGVPQHVPVDWEAVKARMKESKATPASVTEATGSTELADAMTRQSPTVSLTAFVHLASALGIKDFNTLVRAPRWSEATKVDEEKLRAVLYAVDDLRFVVGRNFTSGQDAQLREACEELHASRRVRQMQQVQTSGVPLDERVFAADGEEFLAVAEACDAEVRMQVTPMFISTEGLESPVKLELPAVGRRLTLLMRPR